MCSGGPTKAPRRGTAGDAYEEAITSLGLGPSRNTGIAGGRTGTVATIIKVVQCGRANTNVTIRPASSKPA